MKYEVSIDQDRRLIRIKVWGELTFESISEMTTEVSTAAAKHGFVHFLFDMRETTENADTMDAFFLAANPEERGLTRTHKRAIVHRSTNKLYRFFETVSVNRGYNVKLFTDIDSALEWIQEDG
jgi:hypothetical protein